MPVAKPKHAGAETGHPQEDAALQAENEPVALTAPDSSEIVEVVAHVGAEEPHGAPAVEAPPENAAHSKKALKTQKAAKPAKSEEAAGPREGSKTARVVAMLQRKNGATLAEIMQQMSWQKHTVRGFMAGAMKKAGYNIESFKSDKGERSYRINP